MFLSAIIVFTLLWAKFDFEVGSLVYMLEVVSLESNYQTSEV